MNDFSLSSILVKGGVFAIALACMAHPVIEQVQAHSAAGECRIDATFDGNVDRAAACHG